jgi:predicted MPP superfamily phosphohydrolase
VAGVTVWPLAGLVEALSSGGLGGFLRSLAGPPSWRRAWRVALTLHGARYLLQEAYRHSHPPHPPEEVTTGPSRDLDLREHVARVEGIELEGIKGWTFRVNENYRLQVTTHEVRLSRLPPQFDGFTIAQVSDLHYGIGESSEFVRRYVRLTLDMRPDLVALTGDFQHYTRHIWGAARLLAPVGEWSRRERGGLGALAVLGNHDTWSGTPEVTNALREVGIMVLNNRHVVLERAGASLYVVGVADPWSLRADLPRALLGVPQDACKLLLAHVPDFLVDAASAGVDLQLSGHMHGGQITLPWVGPVLSPSRYNRRYVAGWHKRDRTLMYVCRGLGGHPPIRLGCKPEIALITLRSANK